MSMLVIVAITIVVVSLGVRTLWDRFRGAGDDGIKEWMLNVPGLDGICRDYLDLIREMKSGQHDHETLHHLDSQRQVTHDQILGYLDLDRSVTLDVEAFAKRYLGWS
jgi:hypothetical protein